MAVVGTSVSWVIPVDPAPYAVVGPTPPGQFVAWGLPLWSDGTIVVSWSAVGAGPLAPSTAGTVAATLGAVRAGAGGFEVEKVAIARSVFGSAAASLAGVIVDNDKQKLVFVSSARDGNNANGVIASVTRSGQSFTFVAAADSGATTRAEVWYLDSPTVGTAQITITYVGAAGAATTNGCYTLNNAQKLTAENTATTAATTGANPSAVVTVTAGALVIDAAAYNNQDAGYSLGANQTLLYNVTAAANRRTSSREPTNTDGSVTMSATNTSIDRSLVAASFRALRTHVGAVAATLGRTTGSATGTIKPVIAGTVARTLAGVTGSATGSTGSASGTVARTLAGVTGSATGSTGSASGTVARTLAGVTGSATGSTGSASGTVAVTLGDATGTATGSTGSASGTVVATLAGTTGSASGTITPVITGSSAVTLAAVTGAATGSTGSAAGTVAVTLADVTGTATGLAAAGHIGTVAVTVGATTAAATGTQTITGTVAVGLEPAVGAATAASGPQGSVTVVVGDVASTAAGQWVVGGTVAVTLGNVACEAAERPIPATPLRVTFGEHCRATATESCRATTTEVMRATHRDRNRSRHRELVTATMREH